ncbi:MAG TPA: carbamate kinase [Polyangiales bacterium]|nr:carbamate kinase [Polyangiales bacterium]
MKNRTAVVAFGGNALVRDAEHDSIPDQYETVCRTVAPLVDLIERGWRLVVSHGNGPQVGFILRRSELAHDEVDPVPVDYAVADTQGAIGYMFVKALTNELSRRGLARPVVALVTQSVVDPEDEAFKNPTKPIGSFLSEATARARQKELGWTIMEDAGRGFRRTLPSPRPQRIVESATIRKLLDSGAVVVAAGGGGIPVAQQSDGKFVGVEAVVDKDLASGLLARELGADLLLIPTGISRVAINFGKPEQKWLEELTVAQARAYIAAGEFGAGSMEPKIAAVADFVEGTPGAVGAIGIPEELAGIIAGRAGTRIVGRIAAAPSGELDVQPAKREVWLAINGTLMRGLKLNPNMIEAGATFLREATTEPVYRLWTVDDDHPAMIRVTDGSGAAIQVEVWSVPDAGLAQILLREPLGLSIGKAKLADGTDVLAVLGEPALVEGQTEITSYGGWRSYMTSKKA